MSDAPPAQGSAPAPRRGRPYGATAAVVARHRALRHGHFTFVRFILSGTPLRDAWERCLAYSGGVDDTRHFASRLREICRLIYAGARAHGVDALARTALDDLMRRRFEDDAEPAAAPRPADTPSLPSPDTAPSTPAVVAAAAPPTPSLPTLDEWIDERCAEHGIDIDFQSYADWLREYQEAFAPQPSAPGTPAGTAADPPASSIFALPAAAINAAQRDAQRAQALQQLDEVPQARSALQGRQSDRDDDEEHDDDLVPKDAQISALNNLANLLAVPPGLSDRLSAWCADEISAPLRTVGVVTLADLADFIDVSGFRWHLRVAGLGAVRAARLVAWLAPLASTLGRPLRDASQRPAHQLALARAHQVDRLHPAGLLRFGVVPLERLAVLPELDGRAGVFRVSAPNTLKADDDLAAIKAWLRRHEPTPRTHRAYLHAVEVFYLWCVCVRRVALSSLYEEDMHAFRAFLAAPPAHWISSRAAVRASDDWRPLRGPLGAASQRHLITVIGSLFSGLVAAGYVSVHVVSGIKKPMKLQRPVVNVRRTFSEGQWRSLKASIAQSPDTAATRRLQLVVELAATTGLRLSELCTARLGQLRQESVPSPDPATPASVVWMLNVVGKGGKPREVLVFDDVKALIDRHQADLPPLEEVFDPQAPLRSLDPNVAEVGAPVDVGAVVSAGAPGDATSPFVASFAMEPGEPADPPKPDPAMRPVVGALRQPIPKWQAGELGQAELNQKVRRGDRYGAVDPSALYQSIKRLFARAGALHKDNTLQQPLAFDGDTFAQASTHWLRHFFATSAADDLVDPFVIQRQMGHASIETTLLYVHPERRTLVAQMAKFKRRG